MLHLNDLRLHRGQKRSQRAFFRLHKYLRTNGHCYFLIYLVMPLVYLK